LCHCVVPENIHTFPTEEIFLKSSPPLWKFQLSSIHFFKCFGLKEPSYPWEIPIPSVGRVWIFSGTAHFTLPTLPKLINNSSSLTKGNHDRDGVWIPDVN